MGRAMQIIYYESTENPKKKHEHFDKKGKPVKWQAETKLELVEG